MITRPGTSKIRPDHLDRRAFVYVRQSTLFQVREHTASTARQYDLAQRARDLGWTPEAVTVIDQDQGRSGASTAGRDGFQFLIAQVGLGQAGAVLSLEASRLARSCSDWYRLLEICALTDTPVVDEEGVYDPAQYHDRLLLGIMGTMSEAELHWLRSRLLGGATPSYECTRVHTQLAGPTCQFVRGDGVDAAVARLFLEAIRPAQLPVSVAALEGVEAQARQVERPWQLRLERARYEADLARRRFLAVDPDNRLVARSLEREWNAKLTEVEQRDREHATVSKRATAIGVAVRWQTDACTT